MAKFFAVFKREYLERVRTRWFIITTVFGPVLFGALMTLPMYLSIRSLRNAEVGRIEILDVTGSGLGKEVQARIAGPTGDPSLSRVREMSPAELAAAESAATDAVVHNELIGYLVLDSASLAGTSARYAGRDATSMGQTGKVESAVRQAVMVRRMQEAGLDPQRIDELTRVRLSLSTERITEKGRGGSASASSALGFIVAFLLYMSLILYGQNTLRSTIEEKTTRVAEVIVSSVKTDTLLAGKVLGVAAVGMTQQIVWIVSAIAIYKSRATIFAQLGIATLPDIPMPHVGPGLLIAFLLFYLLGFMFYSSLFAAAGATVNSDQEAQQAAQPIMLLLVFSIIFLQPVMMAPASTMAKVLSRIPVSAPIIMPLRMSVQSVPTSEIIAVLAGLAVACGIAIWLASRIYRVGLLMYGKRPNLRELGRWIRAAG
jgi:ABC-2 type transport system permease protein